MQSLRTAPRYVASRGYVVQLADHCGLERAAARTRHAPSTSLLGNSKVHQPDAPRRGLSLTPTPAASAATARPARNPNHERSEHAVASDSAPPSGLRADRSMGPRPPTDCSILEQLGASRWSVRRISGW